MKSFVVPLEDYLASGLDVEPGLHSELVVVEEHLGLVLEVLLALVKADIGQTALVAQHVEVHPFTGAPAGELELDASSSARHLARELDLFYVSGLNIPGN